MHCLHATFTPFQLNPQKLVNIQRWQKCKTAERSAFSSVSKCIWRQLKLYGGFSAKNGITDACSTADCCSLLSIVDNMPQTCLRHAPDMPQMMPQTCPRLCARHAPDDAPVQLMPQTYLSVSYLISSKAPAFG